MLTNMLQTVGLKKSDHLEHEYMNIGLPIIDPDCTFLLKFFETERSFAAYVN